MAPFSLRHPELFVALDKALEARVPGSIRLLQELVRTPSHRGFELAIQDRISDLFSSNGLQVSKVTIDPKKLESVRGFSPSRMEIASPNIVGVLRGTGGGRSMALNFHMDTAPPGPRELWDTDPFGGLLRDGKIVGSGAWDDKAGCVLALLVLGAIRQVPLKGDLVLEAVIEDEHSGNGTLAVVAEGFGTDAAIVLDGSYGPSAIVGHPGWLTFGITVYGKPAPSCRAELGENAIERAFAIIHRLRQFEKEINQGLGKKWKETDHPVNFNVGAIEGGDWIGSVAARCSFQAQMSFVPPFTVESFKERLLAEVRQASQADEWLRERPPIVEFFDLATDAIDVDCDNEFMSILSEGCEAVFKHCLTPRTVTGWCDMRHFSVFKRTPSCLFGPGKGGNAHRPNEYFEVSELLPHAQVLVRQIVNWCELA